MSSMLAPVIKSALLLVGVSGVAVSAQLSQQQWQTAAPPLAPVQAQQPTVQPGPAAPVVPTGDPLLAAIDQWKALQQSDNLPFTTYANFMLAHPGWPGETSRRAAAETSLQSSTMAPALTVRFFDRFPPLTGTGRVRYAEALLAMGEPERAREQARAAWRSGALRPEDEAMLLRSFPGAITLQDHDARMDALLWQNATTSAQRQIAYVSPARRALFAARLAYRTNSPDAATLGGLVMGADRDDPGFIADRASWLRDTGQSGAARALLAQPHRLSSRPGNIVAWYRVLLTNAEAALADRQYQLAYDIARQVDDAYPPGTDMAAQPAKERDLYTDLVWLAGRTALTRLNRPADAVGLFDRYSKPYPTSYTRAKGLYWAGRAAEAAGDRATANSYYSRAAGYPDAYYGQLAGERLGQPLKPPPPFTPPPVDPATRQAFHAKEIVRAAQLLGQLGRHDDQSKFVRQIAQDATTDADHALATEFAQAINRPDLGVMIGRSALQNGLSDYTAASFPSVSVPAAHQDYWTIIHAIARQESQFDKGAVSHAGARGLMQLMPGTAREQASKLGLGYTPASLNTDPHYNIQLGSSYFQRMLDYYGGSYPLAIAAYNAGPGNVNKWLAANGDPRTGGVDVIEWVEAIPYDETRNYVQRVLENAVVYDLMNPARARSRGPANLSWYLGKSRPG